MQVLPAIDVLNGRAVRLRGGDFSTETVFADDPVTLAQDYARQGAEWLHVVDLAGARDGGNGIAEWVRRLRDCGLRLQVGGGIRSEADVETMLDLGVERVIVGSVAVREPGRVAEWLARFGAERIVLAFDVRRRGENWHAASEGWTRDEAVTLDALTQRYADVGVGHVLCTDIARDGMLSGPNFALYKTLRRLVPQWNFQISGGVHSLGDIRRARDLGAAGIVLGRALLEGRFTLKEALAC